MTLPTPVPQKTRIGANRLSDGTWEFLLWAPNSHSANVRLLAGDIELAMEPLIHGYHRALAPNLDAGSKYFFRLGDSRDLPDPASRYQPDGVHGPSQIVDTKAFQWTDRNWAGRSLEGSVFYELHVGTYAREGTFDALIRHLPELVELGITTIELMPIAQFPGTRNWGYDGTFLFAPQNSYGGPEALQRLVNVAHAHGLAVALDVVYNHLGPEGNYLNAFGPYFTDRYRTPWGQAVNFDGQYSDEVRRFFIENALYWLEDYHIDVLRLDAVHGIVDAGARHFLAELKSEVSDLSQRLRQQIHLIAESDLNDSRLLRDAACGGYGLDAQWSDDFHHAVHTLLTGENRGYYSDFGDITSLVSTLRDGWYYNGQYSPYRKRRHGNSPRDLPPAKFVVCNQNHDQIGNRAAGERLTVLVDFEALKLAAGITLLSPFVPLLFMGEEYGESAPFQYFVSHVDPALVEAVRRGRREEFAAFGWQDSVPDPQAEETFARSHLDHSLREKGSHQTLLRLYQRLIRLRAEHGLGNSSAHTVRELGDRALLLGYPAIPQPVIVIFNFAEFPVTLEIPELEGQWTMSLNSAAVSWNGPVPDESPDVIFAAEREVRLSPHSFLVLQPTKRNPEAA